MSERPGQGFPNANQTFVTAEGVITQAWRQFLVTLWQRSDGGIVAAPGGGIDIETTPTEQIISLTDTGITPGTYGDADHLVIFTVDAAGRLSFAEEIPLDVGDTAQIEAGENLADNHLVNIYDAGGGAFAVRIASEDDPTRYADGFVRVGGTTGDMMTVYFSGTLAGQSGLTPGTAYLSTSGVATSTPPSASGEILQALGPALSATSLFFRPSSQINL